MTGAPALGLVGVGPGMVRKQEARLGVQRLQDSGDSDTAR